MMLPTLLLAPDIFGGRDVPSLACHLVFAKSISIPGQLVMAVTSHAERASGLSVGSVVPSTTPSTAGLLVWAAVPSAVMAGASVVVAVVASPPPPSPSRPRHPHRRH